MALQRCRSAFNVHLIFAHLKFSVLQKPAAKSQVPDPQEAEHDETPANKTTEENEAKSDGETRQGDNTNQAQASPDAKKSKITDQDTNTEPDSEQEVVPQDTGTHKSDAAPLQVMWLMQYP